MIASILRRAVVEGMFGIFKSSVPSFGVLALITVGKVKPPSTDKDIFTLATLKGATFVPALFQVIVWVELPTNDSPPFGLVTVKAVVPTTFTRKVSFAWQPCVPKDATPPPPARLSLTVNLNFIGRATGDNISPFKPFIATGGLVG